MNSLYKKYPPYQGGEPYIYFCFAEDAAGDAGELLKNLRERGCRVWYYVGMTTDIKEEKRRHERLTGAGLVVVYKTLGLKNDRAVGDMMFAQSLDIPVIAIDRENVTNLSLDLRENTPSIPAAGKSAEDIEQALVGTDGFSYEFLGDRPAPGVPGIIKTAAAVMIALAIGAAVLFSLTAGGVIRLGRPAQDPATVTELQLKAVPEDATSLEQYPALEKVVLPPGAVAEADPEQLEVLLENYTVVIRGGN